MNKPAGETTKTGEQPVKAKFPTDYRGLLGILTSPDLDLEDIAKIRKVLKGRAKNLMKPSQLSSLWGLVQANEPSLQRAAGEFDDVDLIGKAMIATAKRDLDSCDPDDISTKKSIIKGLALRLKGLPGFKQDKTEAWVGYTELKEEYAINFGDDTDNGVF